MIRQNRLLAAGPPVEVSIQPHVPLRNAFIAVRKDHYHIIHHGLAKDEVAVARMTSLESDFCAHSSRINIRSIVTTNTVFDSFKAFWNRFVLL